MTIASARVFTAYVTPLQQPQLFDHEEIALPRRWLMKAAPKSRRNWWLSRASPGPGGRVLLSEICDPMRELPLEDHEIRLGGHVPNDSIRLDEHTRRDAQRAEVVLVAGYASA